MNPASHFLISWLTANTIQLDRRERFLITFSGLAPDADGLGIIGDCLTRNSDKPLQWWGEYHHLLGHNIAFGCCLAAGTFFFGQATESRCRPAGPDQLPSPSLLRPDRLTRPGRISMALALSLAVL